jgi:hypothetical protein
MSLTSMTEIEAVNEMLMRANLAPVNSLDTSGGIDVEKAKKILHATNRSVQMRGWAFNTDLCLELSPDTNDQVILPQNTLKVDAAGPDAYQKVTARDGILRKVDRYSGGDATEFTSSVRVDIVYFLEFAEIPTSAQWYITLLASKRFAGASLASSFLEQTLAQEVARALVDLEEAEGEEADFNMLDTMTFVNRRNYSYPG